MTFRVAQSTSKGGSIYVSRRYLVYSTIVSKATTNSSKTKTCFSFMQRTTVCTFRPVPTLCVDNYMEKSFENTKKWRGQRAAGKVIRLFHFQIILWCHI